MVRFAGAGACCVATRTACYCDRFCFWRNKYSLLSHAD